MNGQRKRRTDRGTAGAKSCMGEAAPWDSSEQEHRIQEVVEKSTERFLESNSENIANSSRVRIASASYCGGMVDMFTVTRSVLGSWAVEQLLTELERHNGTQECEGEPSEDCPCHHLASTEGGVSHADAEDLTDHILQWIEARIGTGRKRNRDPMFA